MAGELAAVNGLLDVLRQNRFDWVIAAVVDEWVARGLSAGVAADGTQEAALQLLGIGAVIEALLIPEVEALNYLREKAPDGGLVQLGGSADLRFLPFRYSVGPPDTDAPTLPLPEVADALRRLVAGIRDAVRDEWRGLEDKW